MISGRATSAHLGTGHRSLIQDLHTQYDAERTSRFITDATWLLIAFGDTFGFSIGLADCEYGRRGIEERELILDIFEAVAGSRMMCNYFRFGGVARDLPEGTLQKIKGLFFERLPRKIDEIDRFLSENEIIRARGIGQGVLTAEDAIKYSAAGPLLRASGIPYDVRRAEPYSIYDRFEFDVIVRKNGDIYDRLMVRFDEIRQSIRIVQQAVKLIPDGPVMALKPMYQVRVPPGEAYGRVEGPKGELGFYIVSNGKPCPWRYHVRAPSFINLTAFGPICVGQKVADVVAVLGSIDIVLGEVDR